MTLLLQARNAALERVGEIDDFRSLTMPLRFNRTSGWVLEMDGNSPGASLLTDDGGLIVSRDGVVLLSGPVQQITRKHESGRSTVTVSGFDDTVWLENRLALPVPTGPPYPTAYDVRTGAAETVMHGYVNANLGPGAVTARELTGLTMAADTGAGLTVSEKARFVPLMELLQRLALAGGDLGFRIVQAGAGLQFQVYEPTDLTGTAVFSFARGNLAGYEYTTTRPTANALYVGGSGEDTARTFTEGSDAPSVSTFGRIEGFRDRRDTADAGLLAQALAEGLTDGASTTSLSLSPVDTEAVRFGVDYNLGDRVTVVIDGVAVQDVVREVTLTLTPDGETFAPVVGTPGATGGAPITRLFERLRQQARRTSSLERV